MQAQDNTLVSVADGKKGLILATRTNESAEEWEAVAAQIAEPVLGQGDFFELLRDTQAVEIRAMIELHIRQADAQGRFA